MVEGHTIKRIETMEDVRQVMALKWPERLGAQENNNSSQHEKKMIDLVSVKIDEQA
jgi:hypothetical protein